jgi:hypothetical protein
MGEHWAQAADGSDSACCVAHCIWTNKHDTRRCITGAMKMFRVSARVKAIIALLDFKARGACGCLKRCLCAYDGRKSWEAASSAKPRSTPPGQHSPHRPCTTKPLPAPLHVNPQAHSLPHSLQKVRRRRPLHPPSPRATSTNEILQQPLRSRYQHPATTTNPQSWPKLALRATRLPSSLCLLVTVVPERCVLSRVSAHLIAHPG